MPYVIQAIFREKIKKMKVLLFFAMVFHRWTLFSVMTVSRNPIFRVGHDCSRDIRPHGSNWRFSVMTVFLVCHDLPFVWL